MPYLNIVGPLNDNFIVLTLRLNEMDLRCMYLTSFEVMLSYGMGNDMLWDHPAYEEIEKLYPLPGDPYAVLDYNTFRNRLILYEAIMKDKKLLGTTEAAAPVTGTNASYLSEVT